MLSDKEQKKVFKKLSSKDPEKYYPVEFLLKNGFKRYKCSKCGTFFWSIIEREFCGDPNCSGGFNVVENNPAKVKLSYIDVWNSFKDLLSKRGYSVVDRYPVVARWNPTTDFVIASIAAFQPYVVNGEVEPPASKLIIPQFCLRFGDVDNVGVTGSHLTGFVMIGQHMFVNKEDWNQNQVFKDVHDFIIDVVGLNKSELTIHEDAWAGGGNFGPCMEFFSRGVELFNQVYMMFEQVSSDVDSRGFRELDKKVLDMGLGMERIAWFSQAKSNIYEATFPKVIEYLKEKTNVVFDFDFFNKFSRFSAYLNVDEVDDIDEAWNNVAKKMGVSLVDLKSRIKPMTAIYSIAEHTRSLLIAISDGALPSNVGGGYNLRVILRRALEFIEEFNWDVDLGKVCEIHVDELKDLYPELSENIDNVKKIISVEVERYKISKLKARKILLREIEKGLDLDKIISLYDSNGITPQMILKESKELGVNVEIPKDFYKRVSERHSKQVDEIKDKKNIFIENDYVTDLLYFEDYSLVECNSKLLDYKIEDNFVYLVPDKSVFYPTSGGQDHDIGFVSFDPDKSVKFNVIDVFKEGKSVVLKLNVIDDNLSLISSLLKKDLNFYQFVDFDVRKQLTQHHTATHVINAAARIILGSHINQAGAKKTIEKAHLDLTHYQNISDEEIEKIETLANDIISKNVEVNKFFLSRNDAEKRYGMRIYQGGAIPGKILRIVEIPGYDVEACGGTHLNNTSELSLIKILRTVKIKDGIVRIEFVAGDAAKKQVSKSNSIIEDLKNLLEVNEEYIVSKSLMVFKKWKLSKKLKKKNKLSEMDWSYDNLEKSSFSSEEIISLLSEGLKTQPEHIIKVLKRFMKDMESLKS